MRTIEQLLTEHPFFAGLPEADLAFIAGCATNVHLRAGEALFREGQAADRFFVVRHGRVAIEVHEPAGGAVTVDTVDDGDIVGWSWLVPPYRWVFDARAVESTSAVAFDGACLRGKCDADPRLGYLLLQRVSTVMFQRLEASRVRLLDLYGVRSERERSTAPPLAAPGPWPAPHRRRRALCPPFRVAPVGTPRHLHAVAGAGARPERCASRPGQFTMLSAFGVGEVPISISGDPTRKGPLLHTIRDVGGVTHALAKVPRGDVLGVRGPFGRGWSVADGKGGDVVVVAGGIGLAPLRPAVLEVLSHRQRYGRLVLLYGTRSPDDVLFGRDLEAWRGRFDFDVDVTVDYGPPEWRGRVGLVTSLIARAGFDPRRTLALACGPEVMMRRVAAGLADRGVPKQPDPAVVGAQHGLRGRAVRPLPAARGVHVRRRSGPVLRPGRTADGPAGGVRWTRPAARDRRPRWRCGSSPPATAAS